MITLLQSKSTRDSLFYTAEEAIQAYKDNQYDFSALIESNDLDEAFMLTNNINESWINGERISTLSKKLEEAGGARSASVGDIFGDSEDNYYMVANTGFILLGKLPHPATLQLNTTETKRG